MTSLLKKLSFIMLLGIIVSACNSEPQPTEVPTEEPIDTGGTSTETPTEETNEQGTDEITELKLEIDLKSDEKIDIELDKDRDEIEAEYKVRNEVLKGDEAQIEIENMMNELDLTAELNVEEMIDRILSYFEMNRDEVSEIELEIEKDHKRFIDFEVQNP